MQRLVEGIHKFQQDIFASQQRMFQRLVDGQKPLALFITCSDSRINPNLLTQTQPGELFIMRNAGNIVPPYGVAGCGEAATIEYAVSVLKVEDIVLCGHSHCGAMGALLDPDAVQELPAVRAWLSHAESTARIIKENYSHIREPKARLTATVEENVLVQLENLRTHPSVAAALARGTVKLHGWVYKFETGQVFAYDAAQNQFTMLGDRTGAVQVHDGRELQAI
ncbi:MAG: carbonate dehydratase [Planctomycetota bacterium]|nr:MAG: carbonate dehydratase [Planctomycetota bacterium]